LSNLIITIISIALVAVLAIVGIFYGGAAFENGQAKAYANAIAEQAQQINNAAVQWQADNGGAGFLTAIQQQIKICNGGSTSNFDTSYCTAAGSNPIANVLTPNWLQSVITPPDLNDFAGITRFNVTMPRWEVGASYPWPYARGFFYPGANGYFIYLIAVQPVTSTAVQVCNQIAVMARGPNAVPIDTYGVSGNPPFAWIPGQNPILDCSWFPWPSTGFTQINQCIGTSSNACQIFIAAQVNASF